MTSDEIQALKPGRELDAIIADLMGDTLDADDWWISQDGSKYIHEDRGPKPYSTSIKDAWEVVEKFDRISIDGSIWSGNYQVRLSFTSGPISDHKYTNGSSAPEAICKAALFLNNGEAN